MNKYYQCPICHKIFYEPLGAETCMIVHGYNPLTKRFCKAPATQCHLISASNAAYGACLNYAQEHGLELGENFPDEGNMFIVAMRQMKVIEREHPFGICASCQYKEDDAYCKEFPHRTAIEIGDPCFIYCKDYQPHKYYGKRFKDKWLEFREQQCDDIPF